MTPSDKQHASDLSKHYIS